MSIIRSSDPVINGTGDGDIIEILNQTVVVTVNGFGGDDTIEQPSGLDVIDGRRELRYLFDGGAGFDSINLSWLASYIPLTFTAERKLIDGRYSIELKVDGSGDTNFPFEYHATVRNGEGFSYRNTNISYTLLDPYFRIYGVTGSTNFLVKLDEAIDSNDIVVRTSYYADNLVLGSARDVISFFGQAKADLGGGNDMASVGGTGAEATLNGGDGLDTFVATTDGTNVYALSANAIYRYIDDGYLGVVTPDAGTPVRLKNFENIVFGDKTVRLVTGTNTGDVLRGVMGRYNVIAGGTGNDVLTGVTAGDTLLGGTGDNLVTAGSAAARAANLLTNGSFETSTAPKGKATQLRTLNGWTSLTQSGNNWVTGGRLEIWNAYSSVKATEGTAFLELDANGAMNGIAQSVKTEAGKQYKLTFDFAARLKVQGTGAKSKSGDRVDVFWNGTLVGNYTSRSNSWTTITAFVTGTGNQDQLSFRETSKQNDGHGIFIDNVTLATFAANDAANTNVLDGGEGRDTLVGSAAADKFVFGENGTGATLELADVIRQFSSGMDVVDVSGLIGGRTLTFAGSAFTGNNNAEVIVNAATLGGKTGLLATFDINNDRAADYAIFFEGATRLTGRDFGIA